MAITTLVVGSTGATGKHVVLQLLQQQQNVRAIARSKQRLLDSLDEISPKSSSQYGDQLQVTEASILDLSDEDIKMAAKNCDAVVSCLGHNVTVKGMFGHPRRLVTDATRRLVDAIEANQADDGKEAKKTKFVLMGTVAVSDPGGEDDARSQSERSVLFLLRHLLPPHRDNEEAAEYIFTKKVNPLLEWTVVRPTTLIDGSATMYELFDKPQDSLFGGESVVTRSNVAKCMVDLVLTDSLWDEWKYKWPVVHDMN